MSAVIQPPADAEALYLHGRERRAQMDNAGAEADYRDALRLRPDFVEVWISLGILQKNGGRLLEAEASHRTALQIDPRNSVALLNLGNVLLAQARPVEAEAAFRASLASNPDCAEAHHNLGRLLLDQGKHEDACPRFIAALQLKPGYFEALKGLGDSLLRAQQPEAAIEPLNRAHLLRPADLATLRSLGRAYSGACDYTRAANVFESVLRKTPADFDVRADLAIVQFYSGQYTRPRAALETLLAEKYDDHAAMAYSSLLLRAGEFREGWKYYESRWAIGKPGLRNFSEPRWQGESLTDKTLLILVEQGLGDQIMFASVIPEILPLARRCIIECEQRLVALYQRSFPGATVFGVDPHDPDWYTRLESSRQTLPHFDFWLPVADLARLRRNEAADFPRHSGFLTADRQRIDHFRERLRSVAGRKLKVGIGWRGGTKLSRTAVRSMTLRDLQPLFELPGVHFVNLQYGPVQEELHAFQRETGLVIDHWPEGIDDLDGCAALVSSLDVVVSVCSAIIHLTGALGRPAWVMAPLVPEWRYGREGDSMNWYPSVRMFRQDRNREWGKVVSHVRRALITKRDQAGSARTV